MSPRSLLGVLACAAVVSTAHAQDAPNPVFQVLTLEHTPATMSAWRSAMAKEVAALKAANIPASEVGWWAYTRDNKTILVRPRSRDALFPGGGGGMGRLRQVDSAKAAEVGAAFQGSQVRLTSNEIIEHAPNLSYTPSVEPKSIGGVNVIDIMIAPGQGQAFNEAVRALNEIRKTIDYPYSVQVYRVRMGEPRTVIVTFYDTREAYFGRNSMDTLLERRTMQQEQFQKAIGTILSAVSGWQSWLGGYAENMSYPPM